jgi:SAM-dependent methyltransferase
MPETSVATPAAAGGAHIGPALADDGRGHRVLDCLACGFAHFWPRPSGEELPRYYARGFYETHSPADWADKEDAEQAYWRIEHDDRLTAFAALLDRPSGTLLDVGCGGGWLLARAAACGWDALGVEPSDVMYTRASARAAVVHDTFPTAAVSARAPFDVVHLKQVLEHVEEPAAFLADVRPVVRPGGIVCIEVPNDFNPLQRAACAALAKPPWWIVYPVHLNYFGFDSLERLLRRAGFTPLLREATWPMEGFLLGGLDYVGRDPVGRACHTARMAFEMRLEDGGLGATRRSFRRWLAGEGIGREAVVYARRT